MDGEPPNEVGILPAHGTEAVPDDPRLVTREKRTIIKNILLICLSFLLNFTAFGGISNLQSSLNDDDNLGTASLSIIYGALLVSALFTPTYVIKHLGCKWTMFASILGYTTYSLGNFYPSWYTLVPTSIILGASGAPLWAAKSAYLTTAAKRYALLTGDTVDAVVNKFFGIFFLIFQMNQIIGNLISSFILSTDSSADLVFPNNVSNAEKVRIDKYCGAADCQDGTGKNSTTEDIANSTIYTLMGIYTAVGLLAAANMALFVDKIQLRQREDRSTKELLVATFVHMRNKKQLMLIVITMYSGFEQAFLTGDYTKSFVTCPLAVNWVGFVMICYGACDSLCSILFGQIEKYTGRIPLFSLATLLNLGLIIAFLVWIPYPYDPALYFVLPAFWGVADAVWQTQLNAFYGVLFLGQQEEAFANYRLWESLAFVIAFAYQGFICVSVKLYILIGVLVVGMSFYFALEYMQRNQRDKEEPRQQETISNQEHSNSSYVPEKDETAVTKL